MPGLRQIGAHLGLALCTICNPAFAETATVLSIGDGDTLTVADGSRRVTVRLACIDAPKTAQTLYGAEARVALRLLVPVGSNVLIQGVMKDRYGRKIAEVIRGNVNVNLELVHRGAAFVYRQYLGGCDRTAYLLAEQQAESARLGIWSFGLSQVGSKGHGSGGVEE